MKRSKVFKDISIVSYLLIILMGDMIGIPFFLWLLVTLFNFGDTDQIFAVLAVIGLIIAGKGQNTARPLRSMLTDIGVFFLLSSPLLRRMSIVPIEKYNYLAFIIPATMFVLFYWLSVFLSIRQYMKRDTGT